ERVVRDVAERYVRTLDLAPDQFGQFENSGRLRGGQVEVVVDRGRVLQRVHDAAGQVAAVRVVAHLRALAQDVQRVLALDDLLHEVGHDVGHRELHVARQDL